MNAATRNPATQTGMDTNFKRRSYALAQEHPILRDEVGKNKNAPGNLQDNRKGLRIIPEMRQTGLPQINEIIPNQTPARQYGRRGAPPNRSQEVQSLVPSGVNSNRARYSPSEMSWPSVGSHDSGINEIHTSPVRNLADHTDMQVITSTRSRNRSISPSRIPKAVVSPKVMGVITSKIEKASPTGTENQTNAGRPAPLTRIPSLKRNARKTTPSSDRTDAVYEIGRSNDTKSPVAPMSSSQSQIPSNREVSSPTRSYPDLEQSSRNSRSRGTSPSRIPIGRQMANADNVGRSRSPRSHPIVTDIDELSNAQYKKRNSRSASPSRIPISKIHRSSQDLSKSPEIQLPSHAYKSKSVGPSTPQSLHETHFSIYDRMPYEDSNMSKHSSFDTSSINDSARRSNSFMSNTSGSSLGLMDIPAQEAVTGLIDLVTSVDAMLVKSKKLDHVYYQPSTRPALPMDTPKSSQPIKSKKIVYPEHFNQIIMDRNSELSKSLPQIIRKPQQNNTDEVDMTNLTPQPYNSPGANRRSSSEAPRSGRPRGTIYENYLKKKENISKSVGTLNVGDNSQGWSSLYSTASITSAKSFPSRFLDYLDPSIEAINPAVAASFDPPPSHTPSPPPGTIMSKDSSLASIPDVVPSVGSSPTHYSGTRGSREHLDYIANDNNDLRNNAHMGNTHTGYAAPSPAHPTNIFNRTPSTLHSVGRQQLLDTQGALRPPHITGHRSYLNHPQEDYSSQETPPPSYHHSFQQLASAAASRGASQVLGSSDRQVQPSQNSIQLNVIEKCKGPKSTVNRSDNNHLRGTSSTSLYQPQSVHQVAPAAPDPNRYIGGTARTDTTGRIGTQASLVQQQPSARVCDKCYHYQCTCSRNIKNSFTHNVPTDLDKNSERSGLDNRAYVDSDFTDPIGGSEDTRAVNYRKEPRKKSAEEVLYDRLREIEQSQCRDLGLDNGAFEDVLDSRVNPLTENSNTGGAPVSQTVICDKGQSSSAILARERPFSYLGGNEDPKSSEMDLKRLSKISNRGSTLVEPVLVGYKPTHISEENKPHFISNNVPNGVNKNNKDDACDENKNRNMMNAGSDDSIAKIKQREAINNIKNANEGLDLSQMRLSALQSKVTTNSSQENQPVQTGQQPRQMGRRGMSPRRSRSQSAGSQSDQTHKSEPSKPKKDSRSSSKSSSRERRDSKESTDNAINIGDIHTKTFKIRFYILFFFAMVAMMQCVIWGTWGPILESAKFAFSSWESGTISLFNAWGPIDVIVFIIPVSYFYQRFGLRAGIIVTTLLMTAGTVIRCIPADELGFTILANIGAVLNGIAGCFTLSLPAMIAATWFPPNERTTATAIAGMFSQLGSAVMYLEPLLVRAPPSGSDSSCSSYSRDQLENSRMTRSVISDDDDMQWAVAEKYDTVLGDRWKRQAYFSINGDEIVNNFTTEASTTLNTTDSNYLNIRRGYADYNRANGTTELYNDLRSLTGEYTTEYSTVTPEQVRQDIMILMYIHAAIAGALLIMALCYFPAKPKIPPSRSSAVERLNYFSALKAIFKNPQFMMLSITYVFSVGVPIVWVGVMNFSLCCIGIKQEESMYIAIFAVLLSCVSAFVAARLTDVIYGHLKITCMVLLGLSSICFGWFLLNSINVIPATLVQLYISIGGGVALQYATVPLLIELAVELSYPCPESVVGAYLTGTFNIISGAFLLLFLIPSQCYTWVNYVLVACTSLTIIPLFFVKETHRRRADDNATAPTLVASESVDEEEGNENPDNVC